jgi:hypothetical protein
MLKETEVTGHNYQMVQTKEKTYYYAKTNTNKTWALIQTTGGKDEPAIIFIFRNGQPYPKIWSIYKYIYIWS